MMKLTKLLHKLCKFIQPKKFKLNNNVKPLTQTSINDKIYVLFIPYTDYVINKIKEVIITKATVTFIEQSEQSQIFTFYLQFERNFENDMIADLVGKYYQNGNLTKLRLSWRIKSKKLKILSINTYKGKIFVATDKKEIEFFLNTFIETIKNTIKQNHHNNLLTNNYSSWNINGETSQITEYDHLVNMHKKYSNKLLFKLHTL